MTRRLALTLLVLAGLGTVSRIEAADKIRVLVVDGQNNHQWAKTSPILVQILEEASAFTVDRATSPLRGQDLSGFRPKFSDYDVVLSNYNGDLWPEPTRNDFVEFVKNGGGVVIVHAANNSFSKWPEYNRIIGLGGWGGRNEKSGPYVRFRDGKIVRDESKGRGGSHGRQHEFDVVVRDGSHPITKGLPKVWKHTRDELYDRLRGPAVDMQVLATAYSDPATGGTGEHEPMLMTIDYGKGRVFHTPMGHATYSMECAGFATVLVRGTEWAATGKVTLNDIPKDFPTESTASKRDYTE